MKILTNQVQQKIRGGALTAPSYPHETVVDPLPDILFRYQNKLTTTRYNRKAYEIDA